MGLLSNLLNDNSGEKAAGSVSDMEKRLASDSLITMDAARWITIHPNGEEDYRRIEIDDQTGEILKGGAMALQGTNIKDFGKNMADKKRVQGMSIKTVDEYRAKEDELYKELVKAGHVRNRKDFDEAYSGIKDITNPKKLLIRRSADFYDTQYQHPEKFKEMEEFLQGTKKAAREYSDEQNKKQEQEQRAEEDREHNKRRKERIEAAPLKNEKMEKAVEVFNKNATAKLQELKNKRDAFVKHFDRQKEQIIRKIGEDVKRLSDSELNDLANRVRHLEAVGNNIHEEIHNFINNAHEEFTKITESKTRNKERSNHFLKNLEYGTPLGDFALFPAHWARVPDDVLFESGGSVYNHLMHEQRRRERLKDR